MGAKKKGGKGKKKKGAKEEPEPDDEFMQMDGESLEKNMESLKERLSQAKLNRNMLQMEKDMIHDFYHNTRAEIKELEARVKNFDTDMQDMEEQGQTTIKVIMQKVARLEYGHQANCDKVAIDSQKVMKEEHTHHREGDRDMLAKKKEQKQAYVGEETTNQGEIENQEKELDQSYKDLEENLNLQRKALITNYERKMKALQEELELRMKVEIHEIEERKNQHINELMKNHEDAFREMKEYYNDITRENLELIRMHREKLIDIRNQIEQNQITVEHLKLKEEELKRPLAHAITERDSLRKNLSTFDKDQMSLRNAKARLQVLRNKEKECKQDRAELEEKFLTVEKEKKDMTSKFELAIDQLRSKANYKNQVLDEVLAVRQAELDRKEVQLRELVQRSGLDQGTVDEICKKMEEAIEAKNSIIRNLRYSMAHATKAYNDAIRVYEAKLVEFGIPAEELGLELLETQTSNMPAGLVAA